MENGAEAQRELSSLKSHSSCGVAKPGTENLFPDFFQQLGIYRYKTPQLYRADIHIAC